VEGGDKQMIAAAQEEISRLKSQLATVMAKEMVAVAKK
jgi:hypothetical protein